MYESDTCALIRREVILNWIMHKTFKLIFLPVYQYESIPVAPFTNMA